MLSLRSRIIKQNKKLSKARLRSCVKFIPRPTGAFPGGEILGETCARWRHSSHLTGRQDEWSVWVDRRTRGAIRSFDKRALLGWPIIITNQPTNYYHAHTLLNLFVRSFVRFARRTMMSCSDLNTFFLKAKALL